MSLPFKIKGQLLLIEHLIAKVLQSRKNWHFFGHEKNWANLDSNPGPLIHPLPRGPGFDSQSNFFEALLFVLGTLDGRFYSVKLGDFTSNV